MFSNNEETNITPFSSGGMLQTFEPQKQEVTEMSETFGARSVESQFENNRKRHFREMANCCELVSGAAINGTVCFTFRALGVSAAGYFVALVITHVYFTASSKSDERKRINHIMTGVSASASAIATLGEPINNFIEAHNGLNEFQSDYEKLQPKPDGSGALALAVLVSVLLIGLFAAVKNKSSYRGF